MICAAYENERKIQDGSGNVVCGTAAAMQISTAGKTAAIQDPAAGTAAAIQIYAAGTVKEKRRGL